MLPAHRTEGEVCSIPQFDLTPRDVDGFLDELQAFHDQFRACCARSEPREHFFHSLVGQCSKLERTSLEPMALHVAGGNIRGLQRFLRDDGWDEDAMGQTYRRRVADEMGAPDGVFRVDASGLVKKGQASVGVARQYCGTLGKVEKCPVGVFAASAARQGYALVDKRLFLPELWFSAASAERRQKCQVPDAVALQTKPQLAAAMVKGLRNEGRLPFRYLVADGLSGHSPDFLDAIDACGGVTALVSVPAETRCWLQRPPTRETTSIYQGAVHAKRVVASATQAPLTVTAWAGSLPSSVW